MIINSTNNNKTNNYLSSELIENKKNPRHMTLEIHVLPWDRNKYVVIIRNSHILKAPPLRQVGGFLRVLHQ
jgi:hypothetical protein